MSKVYRERERESERERKERRKRMLTQLSAKQSAFSPNEGKRMKKKRRA
jgi:hypothetical protein